VRGSFRNFVMFMLFFNLVTVLLACNTKDDKSIEGQENVIRITGVVRLVGNDPFLEVVISESDRNWFIEEAEDEQKLRDMQNRTVTVEGIEIVTSFNWANGDPAGERYSLKDIKIIKIE